MAATASNNRPALEVSGELIPLRASVTTSAQRGSFRRVTASPSGGPSGKAASRYAAAIRHGCLIATALKIHQVGGQELTAPDGAVRAVTGPVERDPDDRPVLAVVGQA